MITTKKTNFNEQQLIKLFNSFVKAVKNGLEIHESEGMMYCVYNAIRRTSLKETKKMFILAYKMEDDFMNNPPKVWRKFDKKELMFTSKP